MPIVHPLTPFGRLRLIRSFISLFLPICLVLSIIGSMHYYTLYTTERSSIESIESFNVDLAHQMIREDIANVVRDLRFLAEHIERQGLPEALPWTREQRIAEEFEVFVKNKELYDQIRYLDKNGLEIVRVNYNDGDTKVVPSALLQDKASRYYFNEILSLNQGGIYLSRFDLNMENGDIEHPLKPVIRFGTPVFDRNASKSGIVLINYIGVRLIDNFSRAAASIADHLELINSNGYWLSNPDPENEWGFMLNKNIRFQKGHPSAWKQISQNEGGQFETQEGLFTFTTVSPMSAAQAANPDTDNYLVNSQESDMPWKIVSHIPATEISTTLPLFLSNNGSFYLAIFGLLFLGTGFLARARSLHQVAEAQRDYEQRFRQAMENIDLAVVAISKQGTVIFCNHYFLRICGCPRDEVIGKDWVEEFVSDESKEAISNVIQSMNNREQFPSHLEFQVETKDGKSRLIDWNNTLSFDSKGNVTGVTGIGEDITDMRRVEGDLLKLYQAVEQSPSTVMVTDAQGNIEYVNPKFTEVSGYSAEEIIGKNPRILKSGKTTDSEYRNLWETVKQGREWRGEFHNRRKNGELYWESAAISAIRDSEGEITSFLALKEDITEKKHLEAEIESQHRELAHSQTMAAMGRMASMIAHDLRNPLSSVKMTLQILEKKAAGKISASTQELCRISLEQIRYMEEILSDMLSYSRPDALKPEWITINKVVDMAISLSQRRQDEPTVTLHTEYHPGLPTIYADATKLRQLFSNLISNALQATQDINNARIKIDAMIELGPSGTSVRVDICDNGRGIDSQNLDSVFEPFYTTRAKGTGLGLAIVKRILDQHKATIAIKDNVPCGCSITVVLPVNPSSDISQQSDSQENRIDE